MIIFNCDFLFIQKVAFAEGYIAAIPRKSKSRIYSFIKDFSIFILLVFFLISFISDFAGNYYQMTVKFDPNST